MATPPHHAKECVAGVCDPQRIQGLRAPAPKGEHVLVHLRGPGLFVAAQVTKQGGDSGLTFVSLEIDGRNVINLSFAAADNWGLTQQNPYGVVLLDRDAVRTLTIGFCSPLGFASELKLSATVAEDGVAQLLGNLIQGR